MSILSLLFVASAGGTSHKTNGFLLVGRGGGAKIDMNKVSCHFDGIFATIFGGDTQPLNGHKLFQIHFGFQEICTEAFYN